MKVFSSHYYYFVSYKVNLKSKDLKKGPLLVQDLVAKDHHWHSTLTAPASFVRGQPITAHHVRRKRVLAATAPEVHVGGGRTRTLWAASLPEGPAWHTRTLGPEQPLE